MLSLLRRPPGRAEAVIMDKLHPGFFPGVTQMGNTRSGTCRSLTVSKGLKKKIEANKMKRSKADS